MVKSITHFLIIFFIFQQFKSQISQIDQNEFNPFAIKKKNSSYKPVNHIFVSLT